MRRQNAQFNRISKQIEDRASQMENSVGASFGALGKRIAGAFAGIAVGQALNDIRKTADEYTKIINTLKVAGVKDTAGTFDQLFASAQRNAAPLDALATLYGRVSAAQTTLHATSQEVMQVTDIVAQSLRVGGTSATEASGALLQLSQALAGGKVQAEEYNSLLDGARPLLEAAAAGIKEAGGDVAQLTALVKDGKVSSEAFFRGIQAGAPILEQKLAGASTTTEQALQRMRNEFTKAVGEFDAATGTTAKIAGAMDGVAGSIGGIGKAATTTALTIGSLVEKLGQLYEASGKVQRQQALSYQAERAAMVDRAREMGTANAGGRDTLAAERAAANEAAAAANRKALADFRAGEIDFANRLQTAPLPPSRPAGAGAAGIKPVSLADFKVPGDKDGKSSGGSSKDALDSYENALIASEKRRQALLLEAQSEGKSTFEKAKAREALELETAAKRANIPITEEMRKKIDEAATGYAKAKVTLEDTKKSIEAFNDASKFFGDGITDALGDMIIDGEKASDVMKGLVRQLAKAALQAALMGSGPLSGLFGTTGQNGAAGGLFGMLGGLFKFADGGWVSGSGTGRSDSIPARLSNGEFVVNAASAKKYAPLLEAMNSGNPIKMASGGFAGIAPLVAPKIPAGMNAGGGSKPQVNVAIHNEAGAHVTTQQQPNGDISVFVKAAQAMMADDVLRNRGPLNSAIGAKSGNRQLRG